MNYLTRLAAPWVSIAVLTGGALSAVILLWIVKVEAEFRISISNF